MSKKRNYNNRLTINYNNLGTLSHRELIDALMDDIHIIEQEFGVHFYSNARLIVWASNEYGDPRCIVRPCGEKISCLETSHFRPACLDYDL